MMRNLSLAIAISLTSLFLTACATFNDVSPDVVHDATVEPAGWQAEQQTRQQVKVWEIRGRLGVQTGKEGGTVDIIWKQSDEDFSIRLIAPLGAGTYLIQGDENYADIRYPNGTKKTIDNIDDVFASALDIKLPVTAIRDWVRGMPASSLTTESISWNEKKRLHRLKQSGWNVEMTRYNGSSLLMPHAIYLSRDDNAELDVRLLLRQWLIDN